ncbi:hypothetical protein B0H13DRAFT_2355249 [Mycena leptocephala]|nr:hypothetical protein B0H13DRAFT_2355249 [Mycena leptocephala]
MPAYAGAKRRNVLSFNVSEDYVDGLEPIPNWMALQQSTTRSISPQMKRVLWSLSRVLPSESKALECGFFNSLHQMTEICTLDTGEKIPIQLVHVQPGDSEYAVVQPHHNHHFLFELDRQFWSKILKQFREKIRRETNQLMEDWAMVASSTLIAGPLMTVNFRSKFLALLRRVSVDQYLTYFLSLAEIEEDGAKCFGVVSYGDTTYSEMTIGTREAVTALFGSVARSTDFMRFATVEELDNVKVIADVMTCWTLASQAMPNDRYLVCWCREVARARGVLVEAGLKDGIPTLIPCFTPRDIVRQVELYHSVERKKPFCLNI